MQRTKVNNMKDKRFISVCNLLIDFEFSNILCPAQKRERDCPIPSSARNHKRVDALRSINHRLRVRSCRYILYLN